jgi:hypothetical protein|tara:strand:+ start:46 stop:516 length:471 start_codon:yes stop_codon:yes gene_type:complete
MKKKHNKADIIMKYNNSERGYIVNSIGCMFKPSTIKRNNRVPKITREQIYQKLMLHIEHMKDKFPGSDGRICEYCHKQWTYITLTNGCITGQGPRKKGKPIGSNFSIDRLDNHLTYTENNIVFCCGNCNIIKNQVTFKMCERILELKKERELKNEN